MKRARHGYTLIELLAVLVLTVGHGTADRTALTTLLSGVDAGLLVDVRRFPGSRRNPDVSTDALAQWLPEAGIDYSRVVHGEQRFVHHRPITAGDSVVGTLTVDAVREAGGHAMVTTRTELTTQDGEALCTSTSTIVIRGGE